MCTCYNLYLADSCKLDVQLQVLLCCVGRALMLLLM
jgi:hypothetical protein